MSLTIERFVTRCQVPRNLNLARSLLDQVVSKVPAQCARQLDQRWMARPDIIRIRRLPVRLRVSSAQLGDGQLAGAWAEAFAREICAALAQPTGAMDVVRAESRAGWLATVIADVMAGIAVSRWEYSEFHDAFAPGAAETTLALLLREPSEMLETLDLLESAGTLERLLRLWDDSMLEQLFVAMAAGVSSSKESRIDLEFLLSVAETASSRASPVSRSRLASRGFALHQFLLLRRKLRPAAAAVPHSPQQVLHALTTLAVLVEFGAPDAFDLPEIEVIQARTGRSVDPAVASLLAEIRGLALRNHVPSETGWLARMSELLERLRPMISTVGSTNPLQPVSWVSSECAGLLLLARLLERLDWPEKLRDSALANTDGPRLVTCVLAGLGLSVLNRFEESASRVDTGIALFAGWLGEPDWAGFRRFLASTTPTDRNEILTAFNAESESLNKLSENWAATFDYLARRIIREFASRIRGFRQASRAFVVKHFLELPGRVRVEEKRLVVILEPSPLGVALHLAGMDDPVETVSWLGGRRVEFQLDCL